MSTTQPPTSRIRRRRISSWCISFVFHALLLLLLTLFFSMERSAKTVPGENVAVGEILLVRESAEGEVLSDSEGNRYDASGSPLPAVSVEEILENRFSETRLSDDLPEDTIGPGRTASPATTSGGAGGSAASINTGSGFSGAGDKGTGAGPAGGQTRVTFFGPEGTGRLFVFVIDHSASMSDNGGRAFLAAKRELSRAIDTLTDTNRFNVVFYNSEPKPLFSQPLVVADDIRKTSAKRRIAAYQPSGGTDHASALYMALRLKPEVIFFLTDGDATTRLNRGQLAGIARFNSGNTQINVIQFGIGPNTVPVAFLPELARMNGGQFRYVDTRSFDTARDF